MADSKQLLVGVDYRPFPRLCRFLGIRQEVHTPLAEGSEMDFETTEMMQQMFDDLRVVEVTDGDD